MPAFPANKFSVQCIHSNHTICCLFHHKSKSQMSYRRRILAEWINDFEINWPLDLDIRLSTKHLDTEVKASVDRLSADLRSSLSNTDIIPKEINDHVLSKSFSMHFSTIITPFSTTSTLPLEITLWARERLKMLRSEQQKWNVVYHYQSSPVEIFCHYICPLSNWVTYVHIAGGQPR